MTLDATTWVGAQTRTNNEHTLLASCTQLSVLYLGAAVLPYVPVYPASVHRRHVVKRHISQDALCCPTQTTYTEYGTHANMLMAHSSANSLNTWPLLYMAKPRKMN